VLVAGNLEEELKTCTKCGEEKSVGEFSPAKKGLHSRCKPCRSSDTMAGYSSEARRERGIKEHGLSIDQYLELLVSQGGRCAICGKVPESQFSLHIDHDHECCPGSRSCGDCVRGLLCGKCNSGLGMFDDNLNNLQSAVEYLIKEVD
jgi:hypothetical protein